MAKYEPFHVAQPNSHFREELWVVNFLTSLSKNIFTSPSLLYNLAVHILYTDGYFPSVFKYISLLSGIIVADEKSAVSLTAIYL